MKPAESQSTSRSVWSGSQVAMADHSVRIAGPGCQRGEPTLQLIQENDLVRAIDVTCSCGKTLRIVLEYSSPAD